MSSSTAEYNPARRADDYDSGAGWDRVADAMDLHGAAAVLADPGLVEAPPAPVVWPERTHDGQRHRTTETADVVGEVL